MRDRAATLPERRRAAWRTTAVVPVLDAVALAAAWATAGGHVLTTALAAAAVLAILASSGLHGPRINPRVMDDAAGIVARVGAGILIAAPPILVQGDTRGALRFAATAAVYLLVGRIFSYALVRAARCHEECSDRAVIVGAGDTASLIAEALDLHPEYGLVAIGFVDSVSDENLLLPVLGSPEDLPSIVKRFDIDRVIVAFGRSRERDLVSVLRTCEVLPVQVHVVPRLFEVGVDLRGPAVDEVWGIPLVRIRGAARASALAKRAFDVAVASVALAGLAAPMLAIAFAVRTSSPGPALFRQRRIGRGGVPFEVLKFRTMRMNDDSDRQWCVADDDRLTGIGRFLRRTGLDELPQLINVLRGEMSLVGPRPERPHFAETFAEDVPGYADRHRLPTGITGWAQVHGLRGDTSIRDRARFDNFYIEHWSLWRDVVILVRTVKAFLRGEGR